MQISVYDGIGVSVLQGVKKEFVNATRTNTDRKKSPHWNYGPTIQKYSLLHLIVSSSFNHVFVIATHHFPNGVLFPEKKTFAFFLVWGGRYQCLCAFKYEFPLVLLVFGACYSIRQYLSIERRTTKIVLSYSGKTIMLRM